jgi:hypothetical protein
MPIRTVVLMRTVGSGAGARDEQVTNSNLDPAIHDSFPQDGDMPPTITYGEVRYDLAEQIEHEEDHPDHELYHYLQVQ